MTIYIVSGFPRSGTTAMMQALEAGGLEAVKNDGRTKMLQRSDDYDFKSHAGYESTAKERNDLIWPTQYDGMVVKTVVMWLPALAVHEYRVVFMRRNTEEIRQSFEASFGKIRTCQQIEDAIDEAKARLENRRDVLQVTEVWYDDLLANPVYELNRLGWSIDMEKASKVIDQKKKRFDLQILVAGA